jgi:hypothetical protein
VGSEEKAFIRGNRLKPNRKGGAINQESVRGAPRSPVHFVSHSKNREVQLRMVVVMAGLALGFFSTASAQVPGWVIRKAESVIRSTTGDSLVTVISAASWASFSPGGSDDMEVNERSAAVSWYAAQRQGARIMTFGSYDSMRYASTNAKTSQVLNNALAIARANYVNNRVAYGRGTVSASVIPDYVRGVVAVVYRVSPLERVVVERVVERRPVQAREATLQQPVSSVTRRMLAEPSVGVGLIASDIGSIMAPSFGIAIRATDRWTVRGSIGETTGDTNHGMASLAADYDLSPGWVMRGGGAGAWVGGSDSGFLSGKQSGWFVGPALTFAVGSIPGGVEAHAGLAVLRTMREGDREAEWLPALNASLSWRPFWNGGTQ